MKELKKQVVKELKNKLSEHKEKLTGALSDNLTDNYDFEIECAIDDLLDFLQDKIKNEDDIDTIKEGIGDLKDTLMSGIKKAVTKAINSYIEDPIDIKETINNYVEVKEEIDRLEYEIKYFSD